MALLSSGSSHGHARSTRAAGTKRGAGAKASGSHARSAHGTAAASSASAGESPEIRRLIALGRPIYCAARRGNEVALTFDDGPHAEGTGAVLEILRAAGARAIFFLVGEQVEMRPALAGEVGAAGHAVGFVEDQLAAAVEGVVGLELPGLGGIRDLLHAYDHVHGLPCCTPPGEGSKSLSAK